MQNYFFLVLALGALASSQSVFCPDNVTQCDGCQYCPGNQGLCSNCQPADVATCSPVGSNPYSTGSLKTCCPDLQQCSANFNNDFSGSLGSFQCSAKCVCTAADVDTYTTGDFVPCCSGYTSCLKDWNAVNVFTYKCVDPTLVSDCRNSPCPVNAERTCTLTGGDNYCTGNLLPCCGESISCLKEWYPNTGNYFFKCVNSAEAVGCLNTPYTFVGDFMDGTPRAFSKQFPGTSFTPATCYEAAKSSKLTVFGLQYGGECWADNDLSNVKKYGKANATMTCNQDKSFMCGGPMVNSIFTLPISTPTQPDVADALYGNVGCFADGTPRAFIKQFPGVLYTAKTCYDIAKAAGFTFFALQYGGECWATSSKQEGIQYGESTKCTMPCTSAPGENCGGPMANNVFSTVIESSTSV